GEPEAIGIHDLAHPDYGDAVTINPGETPVFWPCGVTPQNVVMHSKPEFCITHAPGHMFVTDVKNSGAEILRADSKNHRGTHCAPLQGRSIALCLKVED
ncbi:protein containing DUF1445, partial [human gut metagenome]